jgi:uncharacterized protein (DUF1499 family)
MFEFIILNDITTTFPNPPAYIAIAQKEKNRDYIYDESNYAKQQKKHPEVKPLATALSPVELFAILEKAVALQPRWKIVSADKTKYRIEVEATSLIFRYVDDVVIEIRNSEVHMRSKSRVGRSDLGANASRINNFLAQIKSQLSN